MGYGKILSIKEVRNVEVPIHSMFHDRYGNGSYDGFEIEVKRFAGGTFKFQLLIENGQQCCEDWGYFVTGDNYEIFVGEELKDIKITDADFTTKKLEEVVNRYQNADDKYLDTMFVTIETPSGSFQFVAYNAQNGYYGHYAIFRSIGEVIGMVL